MGLMTGTGPLGRNPSGTFNFELPPPGRSLYLEPTPKRIRVEVEGRLSALWTIREGKAVRFEWFHGAGEALEALGN